MADKQGDYAAVERTASHAWASLQKYQAEARKQSRPHEDLAHHTTSWLDAIGKFISVVSNDVSIVGGLVETGHWNKLLSDITAAFEHGLGDVEHFLKGDFKALADKAEGLGGTLIDVLLKGTMGFDLDSVESENKSATNMVKRVIGLSMLSPIAGAAFGLLGRIGLSERMSESAPEIIGHWSEHLGLGLMIGTFFEELLMMAVGQPLEETINEKFLPQRLDRQTLRALARQHRLSGEQAQKYFRRAGFDSTLQELYMLLDSQQLPAAELQTAYLNGAMTEDKVKDYLEKQGFSDQDVSIIIDNYIHKGETQAGSTLRNAARTAYRDEQLDAGQFRTILQSINIPDHAIDLEIQALDLERKTTEHHLSLAQLKQAYVLKDMTPDEVHTELRRMRYPESAITTLTQLWDRGGTVHEKRIPSTKILLYHRSGVLSRESAIDALLAQGYRSDDAAFMVDHPTSKRAGYDFGVTAGTVKGALRDSIINGGDAMRLLQSLGMNQEQAQLDVKIALHNQLPHRGRGWPQKHLAEKTIKQAVLLGLEDITWAVQQYEAQGYSTDDAILQAVVDVHTPGGDSQALDQSLLAHIPQGTGGSSTDTSGGIGGIGPGGPTIQPPPLPGE